MKKMLIVYVLWAASLWGGTSEQAFQKMLSLEGTWEGTYQGETIRLVYEPISGNTALMERMVSVSDGSSMTTVYHPQKNRLMATHYCKMKNQPRLVSLSNEDSGMFKFEYMDGANPGEKYLAGLELKFINENQIEQTVRFQGNSIPIKVLYTRK